MGGQIAMEFCRQYPALGRGLLLAATFPQPESELGKLARNTMADRLLREGMKPYTAEVLDQMLAPQTIATRPVLAAAVQAMMEATDPTGAAAALRGRAERPSYEPVLANSRSRSSSWSATTLPTRPARTPSTCGTSCRPRSSSGWRESGTCRISRPRSRSIEHSRHSCIARPGCRTRPDLVDSTETLQLLRSR